MTISITPDATPGTVRVLVETPRILIVSHMQDCDVPAHLAWVRRVFGEGGGA